VKDPGFIEVHRLGTFPERSLDIDVVFDLMIHDLDLVLSIVQSEVESLEAVGVPVLTDRADIANARIRFASGCVANITASRISRDRTRKIRFFQRDAYISIDCGAKEAEVYRLVRHADRRPTIEGGKIDVPDGEPLRNELQDFVDAVRTRRAPLVGGADGRRAVALAADITERMAACTRI
jgi:predicted dehydrogenase